MNVSIQRRRVVAAAAAAVAAPAFSLPADKGRPLRIIVPLAAGGSTDVVARALARSMEQDLGRPVVVDNRAGGQGAVASAAVAGAPPDGLTLLFAASSIVQNPSLYKDVPNHLPQLRPVSQVIASPNALAVSPRLGVQSLAEFIDRAKGQPGALSVGTVSTLGQAICGLLRASAQIDLTVVPYRGEAQAIPDVLGGHLPAMIGSPGTLLQNGLKVLAVAGSQRSSSSPDIPTFPELGHPRITMTGWLGMFAPTATPGADVKELERAIVAGVRAPEVAERIRAVGMEPVGSSADGFQEMVSRELAFWASAAKELSLGPR